MTSRPVHCPCCGRDMQVKQHIPGRPWSMNLDVLILQWSGAGIAAGIIGRAVNASAQGVWHRVRLLKKAAERV